MAVGETLALRAGRGEATIRGGALLTVASWRVDGVERLAAPDALPAPYRVHGCRAGITLMHPWANRLGAARFSVAGRELRADDDDVIARDGGGLPIHGLRGPGAWEVTAEPGGRTCRSRRVFAAVPAFPFAHELVVAVHLREDGTLEVVTSLRATGGDPVPVAFGWHPYLVGPGDRALWRLRLPARTRLVQDAAGLPCGEEVVEAAEDRPLGTRTFDDGYADTEGASWGIGDVTVCQDVGYPCGQVFAPADAAVVSLEPMTAPTDALRSGRRLRILAPGQRADATFSLRAARTADR